MKKEINDLLLKMQTGENCIGETANQLLDLFAVSCCHSSVCHSEIRVEFFADTGHWLLSQGVVGINADTGHWLLSQGVVGINNVCLIQKPLLNEQNLEE